MFHDLYSSLYKFDGLSHSLNTYFIIVQLRNYFYYDNCHMFLLASWSYGYSPKKFYVVRILF